MVDNAAPRPLPRRGRPPLRALREPVHVEAHAEEPKQRATRKHRGGQSVGYFDIDTDTIPDGMSYEWKRVTINGMRDGPYEVRMAEQGWTAVPASRHPELVPMDWTNPTIERGGQVLMERPMELTLEAQAEVAYDAAEMIRVKEQQLGLTPRDQMERNRPTLSHKVGPVEIPD